MSNSGRRSGFTGSAALVGVSGMSAAVHVDASLDSLSADERMAAAFALLKRVLDLLDRTDAPPELAARVQEALDSVGKYRPS